MSRLIRSYQYSHRRFSISLPTGKHRARFIGVKEEKGDRRDEQPYNRFQHQMKPVKDVSSSFLSVPSISLLIRLSFSFWILKKRKAQSMDHSRPHELGRPAFSRFCLTFSQKPVQDFDIIDVDCTLATSSSITGGPTNFLRTNEIICTGPILHVPLLPYQPQYALTRIAPLPPTSIVAAGSKQGGSIASKEMHKPTEVIFLSCACCPSSITSLDTIDADCALAPLLIESAGSN